MLKSLLTTVIVVLVAWTIRFGWNLLIVEPVESPEEYAQEWIAEDSQWVSDEIASGVAAPARGWFDAPRHGTFEADPGQLRELVDQFHTIGAERVWVVGIEQFDGTQVSDSIAVELPASGPARAQLFAVEAALWGGEGTPDLGQKYLVVSLD